MAEFQKYYRAVVDEGECGYVRVDPVAALVQGFDDLRDVRWFRRFADEALDP